MLQSRPVRAAPIHPAAAAAHLELIVVLSGPRQKCRVDRGLGDLLEDIVAAEAPRKGPQVVRSEPTEHFHELTVRVGFADEVAVRHQATLQKTLIASQQNSSFATGELRQFRIVRISAICRVETGESQPPRQLPQVDIDDETDHLEWPRTDSRDAGDINGHEPREDRKAIAFSNEVIEGHGFAVDEHQVNLWMGHAEALDDIFDGRVTVDGVSPGDLPPLGRHEIVERAVHANNHLRHVIYDAVRQLEQTTRRKESRDRSRRCARGRWGRSGVQSLFELRKETFNELLSAKQHVSEIFRFRSCDFEPQVMQMVAEDVAQGPRVLIGECELHRAFSSIADDNAPSAQRGREHDRARRRLAISGLLEPTQTRYLTRIESRYQSRAGCLQ
jgi:hypothetical protein